MVLEYLDPTPQYRLTQICHTLKSVHGVDISGQLADVDNLEEHISRYNQKRDKLIEASSFNSYAHNPEYIASMLILEAFRIQLKEVAPRRRRKQSVKEAQDSPMVSKDQQRLEFARKLEQFATHTAPPSQTGKLSNQDKARQEQKDLFVVALQTIAEKMQHQGTSFARPEENKLTPLEINIAKLMRHAESAGILDSMDARKMDMVVNKGVEMYGNALQNSREEIRRDPEIKHGDWEVDREIEREKTQKGKKDMSESKNKKPDADGDGIPDWADKNPKKPGGKKDRKMNEAELSPKQRKMAALGGNKSKIDAADMAALRHGATIDEDDWDFDMDFGDDGQGMGMMHNPADDAHHDPEMHSDIKDIKQVKGVDIHHSDAHKEDIKHYEYQASMARSELYRNAKYGMAMLHQVKPEEEIQPWIAGALTKAANYLDKIYHYLDYYKTFEPEQLPEDMDMDMELGETSGSIARQNLMMICEYSTKLFDMIKPGDHLEGWVAMKLTTASECISSSKHYLEYVQFETNGLDDHFDDARRANRKMMAEGAIKSQKKRRRRLAEQQDLEQAETLLAAKDLSDQLQQTAEKLAKMGVEDLMPLVDVMRQQFGPEAASGFNDTVKAALDGLLDSTTQAKEQVDSSIDTLQGGGVPAQAGTPEVTGAGDELGGEMPAAPELGAEEPAPEEPLGRSKKEPMAEAQSDYAKRRAQEKKADAGKPVKPPPKNAKTDYEKKRAQEKKTGMTESRKKCMECGQGYYMEARNGKMKCDKCGKTVVDETKKNFKRRGVDEDQAPGQTDPYSGLNDTELQQKANSGDNQAKTLLAVRNKKPANGQTPPATQTMQEVAPAGDKAERFIRKNKAAFNKRYGADRGEEVLYRTAWKQFGETSQAQQKAQLQLESVQSMIKNLNTQLKVYKADYRRQLKEGTVVDPLNTGYGLDGEIVMGKIKTYESAQRRLQQIIESEQRKGIKKIQEQVAAVVEIRNLQSQMNSKPWGVVYRDHTGKQQQKFFESAANLKLWHGLNKSDIKVIRSVKPQDWQAKINKLKKI
ncbi:hypothetical protein UFOVP29_217 [uncultured Caudovirales phage]|uniref:Uncharacterized protein n=1 Tax=uncultured Caudovirales phage TaxID=2100421 RepID=A0A6J5KLF3_9CAUD|nr:hypothetical protein UFOVP29_217 [uncultured Caudovirales phage]